MPATAESLSTSGSRRLIIFVRAPRLGTVKTRLAAALGAPVALEAYQTLVRTVVGAMAPFSDVELRYTPDDAEREIRHWRQPRWHARPQGEGDLGARMSCAFREAVEAGAKQVALIGSDCPDITMADIEAAWSALARHDVVLGPATDGGYWLIAARRWHPGLFGEISWSSSNVLSQTKMRAATEGLSVGLLRTLADIDTAEQWVAHTRRTRSVPMAP